MLDDPQVNPTKKEDVRDKKQWRMKTDEEWRSEKNEEIFVNESRHCNSQLIKMMVTNKLPIMQQELNTEGKAAVRRKKQWREELVIFFVVLLWKSVGNFVLLEDVC